MYKYIQFDNSLQQVADRFKQIDKKETIRIISHLDSDGICACSILVNALNRENRKYSISIVPQLNEVILNELSKEKYGCYFFTDLGSGQLSKIKSLLSDKKVFILDHHRFENTECNENICHANPHLFGIDGSREIAGAGVVYLFTRKLNEKNKEMAHIAIIGAIGDVQEENGFLKLNNDILEEAVKEKKIKVKRGLRFFGAHTKPLHKVLEYSTDPYIPGVSGSESGAIKFLYDIGIDPKKGRDWKKLIHLDKKEMKKLVTGVIMKRLDEDEPDDVLGNIYVLNDEKEEGPLREAKEFSTLLNACGRLDKASSGIGACLGDKKIKRKAVETLANYRKEIIKIMRWYEENKQSIIKENNYMIINAKDNVLSTVIGTMASLLAKSNEVKQGTYILALARTKEKTTKASLRIASKKQMKDIDLKRVMSDIIQGIDGTEAGGHANASGAIISEGKEKEFVEAAKKVLKKL